MGRLAIHSQGIKRIALDLMGPWKSHHQDSGEGWAAPTQEHTGAGIQIDSNDDKALATTSTAMEMSLGSSVQFFLFF